MWNTKELGGYLRSSNEALQNAQEIYRILYHLGWTLEAVCGVLGNVEAESNYNPWRWQGDVVLRSDSPYIDIQSGHAYGLFQMDPAAKYIRNASGYAGYGPNYSDQTGSTADGAAQCRYLNDHADYIPTPSYNITFEQYKRLTADNVPSIGWIAAAWFYNYERGTWSESRAAAAEYWFTVLQNFDPTYTHLPIWMLFKFNQKRR